jgi:cytochrome c-type biogenesis protein CcmF
VISDLGRDALAGGLVAAVAATLSWLRLALGAGSSPRQARLATGAILLASACAAGALEWALVRHDFAIRFVADNGGRDVPLYYTVTSMWSSLDGSLLLWLLILGGYAALMSVRVPHHDPRLHRYAMAVVSGVAVFFFALTYFAANPFQQVQPAPGDGPGPNPLLQQHPAMGVHPPILYAGYIGMVVPFAYAVAGLLTGADGWPATARRWTLPAWSLLTAGITVGAWWSYAVLGWGGYWSWDPVENASLLPWLTATAFLHSTLTRRQSASRVWSASLATASFLLVLVGTLLTRSGAVASVHAFTDSPLGPMLLGFLLLVTLGVVVLIGWRGGPGERGDEPAAPVLSRESMLVSNRVVLVTITAVVLIGTVFPLLDQALSGNRTAVGAGYYDRSVIPLALALLVLMGLAPLMAAGRGEGRLSGRRALSAAAAALVTVAAVGLTSRPGLLALAAFGSAAFALVGATHSVSDRFRCTTGGLPRRLRQTRRAVGAFLAHAGITVIAVGATASAAYPASTERQLTVGQSIQIASASARLTAVDRRAGDGEMSVDARLAMTSADHPAGSVTASLRHYSGWDTTVSVPGIQPGLLRDRYATLIAVSDDGTRATIRLAVNPMIGAIWLGGAMTAAGGLLCLSRRRGRSTSTGRQRHVRAAATDPRSTPAPAAGTHR